MTMNDAKKATKNLEILQGAITELFSRKDRSTWNKGVTAYAIDFIDWCINNIRYFKGDLTKFADYEQFILNGAPNWSKYSWGGSALIYDGDIAAALCTPSELKRTCNGELRPNSREYWLDTQARALYQAANRSFKAIRHAATERSAEQ